MATSIQSGSAQIAFVDKFQAPQRRPGSFWRTPLYLDTLLKDSSNSHQDLILDSDTVQCCAMIYRHIVANHAPSISGTHTRVDGPHQCAILKICVPADFNASYISCIGEIRW